MSGRIVSDAKTANVADAPRIAAPALAAFIKRALEAASLRSDDAKVVADLMVEADLRGSDTHGVIRLPLYLRRLKAGGINPRPEIRIVQERPATALVDGDNGIGHLVMRFAAMTAIEKAKGAGVAWVGARMSNHAGPAALYAMMPLAHDMIGLYLAVGSNGKPLTDPKRAEQGLLLPIGDYKGYGLSLMTGLLAGTLNQAAFGRDVVDFVKEQGKATNTGHAIVAVSVEAFAPAAAFKRQVDAAIRAMRGAQRLPGVERIWLPGEQSHLKRQDRVQNGIPMPKPLRESLETAARDLGIAPLA